MLQFEPQVPGELESEEAKRARARGQALADKSYAGREAQYFDGIKKLAAKFNRATVLVLKHTDALINLDMHQFLKSDPIKRLDPETKYRRLRQYFSERWGPHSSLDVAKIKADLTSMQGDNPGWRKYLQNFNYYVGSLEQTLQRDAHDAIIYGPAPAATYPVRPLATAPAAEHTAYIVACQQAEEIRDAQYPHGGPALNHKPTDAELKTILLDALAASTLRAYQTLYQQYCNRSSTGKTYQDLYNDIHDLVKYDSDGIKSSTAKDSDMDESDGSRSTKESSRSSNSHSSRRNQQIAAAANYLAQQQVAANTAANANIRYLEQPSAKHGSQPPSPGQGTQPPCKNCKSTKHTTKWCTSTKCYEPNCGKSFKDAAERKEHYVREHGFNRSDTKPPAGNKKSPHKKGQLKPAVKFSKVNRVQSEDGEEDDDDSCIDSEVSSDSSMSVDRPPKSITWKNKLQSRKVSKIRTVSTIHRTTKAPAPSEGADGAAPPPADEAASDNEPPPLVEGSSDDSDDQEQSISIHIDPRRMGIRRCGSLPRRERNRNSAIHQEIVADPEDKVEARTARKRLNSPGPYPRMNADGTYSPREPDLADVTANDEPPPLCDDSESSGNESDPEGKGKASPQSEARAPTQVKGNSAATPEATRKAKPIPTSTRQTRSQTRERRIVHGCDSEDHPVKGPEPSPKKQRAARNRTQDEHLKGDASHPNANNPPTDRSPIHAGSSSEIYERNEGYPKYFVDEFENLDDTMTVYIRYRIAGGKMKYREDDTGAEDHYKQWPGIQLEENGDWCKDFNNIAPCEWTIGSPDYNEWYLSTHPKPVDIQEATRYWLDRRTQLYRRQHPAKGSYEEFLQIKRGTVGDYDDGRYDYIDAPLDTWDKGSLYRMHMIRKQAAIDLTKTPDEGIFITEQDIDDWLILNHEDDEEELAATARMLQKRKEVHDMVQAAIQGLHRGATRLQPNPPAAVRLDNNEHDWDFFYRSLLAPPETRAAILTTMNSGTKPVLKSELRTQQATTLSERVAKKQRAMRTAIRKQRHVNAIVDTGAQVTTMPESAVSRVPMAHNHRDAPPGTAVKYGNGEIETIERLVDIGHYEVQITPDNCSTSLISVDQIVEDGHTVTFTKTQTVIADETDRYSLAYPRVPNSREWTIPMHAMGDISQLRQDHPQQKH